MITLEYTSNLLETKSDMNHFITPVIAIHCHYITTRIRLVRSPQ